MLSLRKSGWQVVRSLLAGCCLCAPSEFAPALRAADLIPVEPLGLRVARGFRVTLWADADLANDIQCMTLNARGDVVVSGPGYIRTLLDTDHNGAADTAIDYASIPEGAQGLCFDGAALYCVGAGALQRYVDANDDGQADGAPESLLSMDTAEHGGHGLCKGPDGWLYLIAGNEATLAADSFAGDTSPVRKVEGGALLRLNPSGRGTECIAHGFRNPHAFDFNWLGDLFTYDSDLAADIFLPWYTPARLYHVGYAGHHGWRLRGWRRSWARPDYYADTVSLLAPMGQSIPSGVLCYRHYQFPLAFRNGLFACDWNSGRVYFTPLAPAGATYRAAPDVFLEPIGTHGFAPSGLAVMRDGSLLVSIGGRKTRGGIFRIEFPSAGPSSLFLSNWIFNAFSEVESVINAPQPLDAWSRAYWVPVAQRLGPTPFAQVLADNRQPPSSRVRAVEILTELFGGLPPNVATAGAQAASPFVRARTAWSAGRAPPANLTPLLLGLSQDLDPGVRRWALESLADHAADVEAGALQQALIGNLGHADKRVRQAAGRLAMLLPDAVWNTLWSQQSKMPPDARLTATLAFLWRSPQNAVNVSAIDAALSALAQAKLPELRLDAVRLIILALGDYHLTDPTLEVYTAYEPAISLPGHEPLAVKVRRAVGAIFPSGDPWVNFEAARLLAMLEDDAPETPAKTLSLITDRTPAAFDFHYLTVLSRLRGPGSTNEPVRVARALLALDRKLGGAEIRNRQNWTARLAEITQRLLLRDPQLADALLRDPSFALPAHVLLVSILGSDRYLPAARLFLAAVRKNPRFPWTGPLVDVLAALPPEEVRPLLRAQWGYVGLRDDLVIKLAQKPEVVDRDKFIVGLLSLEPQAVRACMSALLQLPRDPSGKTMLPALRLLRRLLNEPAEQVMRAQVLMLLDRETGQSFRVQEVAAEPADLKIAYKPVFEWFAQKYPTIYRQLDDSQESPGVWALRLKSVLWQHGAALRGEAIFRERGCQICHVGSSLLGPDLGGIASRMSPVDLFSAIVFPNREIAPPYRTTTIRTRAGLSYTGLVVAETPGQVIVQTGATTTVRLSEANILSRTPSTQSLMPAGLLNGLKLQDLADLYAYLRLLPPGSR